jgi:hypothetical protein
VLLGACGAMIAAGASVYGIAVWKIAMAVLGLALV